MKSFLIAFAVIAAVSADVSHLSLNEYLPPVQQPAPVVPVQTIEYVPPVQQFVPAPVPVPAPAHVPSSELTDDGYRYKTQRRVVYRRQRRDVSHLPSNDYLPPVQHEAVPIVYPTNDYLPPVQQAPVPVFPAPVVPSHTFTDDGYRYKTQRRVVYRRNRRDVSHLPINDYLPPVQQEYVPVDVAPIQEVSNTVVEDVAPTHVLGDDGYRYKTQRRVVYRRNRRDVSHLPTSDYLPPAEEATPILDAPIQDITVVQEPTPSHTFDDDGYHYKTQRRVVYRRNRRDVSHLPSNDYLPPVQKIIEIVPLQPVSVIDQVEPAHVLGDDGYLYKTQRRAVYRRNRRYVEHLLHPHELAALQQEQAHDTPSNDYLPPVEQQPEPLPSHDLSNDGYRYKTQRRAVYRRNRRYVEHLLHPHELAALQQEQTHDTPSNDYLPPVEHQPEPLPSHDFANDGYRYKTQRRVVFRRH